MTVQELLDELDTLGVNPAWEIYIHSPSDTYPLKSVSVESYLGSGPLCVNLTPY